jgi:hypothetical protein
MTDDIAARKTYRYVRLGMVGAVVLLGASVLLEHQKVEPSCWQTSISAYYYTPARAVFVGALMAIGLSLIVIKGNTDLEDACLNVAGMLAPVVALVPTSDLGRCWSITPSPLPTVKDPSGDDPLAGWVVANIDNNIRALILAGSLGLAAAAVIAGIAVAVGRKRERNGTAGAWRKEFRRTALGLLGALLFLVASTLLFHHWDAFDTRSHGFAAMAMFGALAAAAAVNARECFRCGRRGYFRLYLAIAVLMVAAAGLMFADWDHKVLAVEVIEITLFAAFWLGQTSELWNETVRPSPPDARPPA